MTWTQQSGHCEREMYGIFLPKGQGLRLHRNARDPP